MQNEELAKQQLKWLKILTVAVLVLLCLALITCASLLRTVKTAQQLGAEISALTLRLTELSSGLDAQELQQSVEALERAANKLGAVDWELLGSNASQTMAQAEISLQEMSAAMEKMDFEALNRAITDLQTVIAPLASFTARFG